MGMLEDEFRAGVTLRAGPTLAELEARVDEARAAVAAERKRLQDSCSHPIDGLTFTYSGVSSYRPGRVEHSMVVRCPCGKYLDRRLAVDD